MSIYWESTEFVITWFALCFEYFSCFLKAQLLTGGYALYTKLVNESYAETYQSISNSILHAISCDWTPYIEAKYVYVVSCMENITLWCICVTKF